MKKTKLLSLSAIFAILTLLFCVNAYAQSAELTIYIDQATTVEASLQNGTKDAPYAKIETALAAFKNAEADYIEVVLMSDYTQATGGSGIGVSGKTVIITAESDTTQFKLPNGSVYPCPPNTEITGTFGFKNITLVKGLKSTDFYDIALRRFNLVIGENTKTTGGIIGITQSWDGENLISDQVIDIDSEAWPNFRIDFGTYTAGSIKGNATINVNGKATAHILGAGYRITGADVYGTQNYIFNNSATIRELYFGKASAQHGKRYVQVNAKAGLVDLYTTGDSGTLTSESYSGVNIIELNNGTVNSTGGEATTGGDNKTEPANYKKINAYPGSEDAWKTVTRVVIFNNNVLGDITVGDSAAIVLRVAEGGYAAAITTEPTAENNWDCELLGFEVTLPEGKDLVYVDGVAAVANEDGLYVIEKAGESKITFGNKYTVTIDGEAEKYAPGTKIALPEAPEKENAQHYTFKWSDGENEYDAGAEYTVNADAEFTPVWTARKYTVKFVNGDGTSTEEELSYDSTITAPDAAVLDGHTFDGWYNGEEKLADGTKVTGGVTYTAKYSKNSYSIEINAIPTEGGSVSGAGSFEYGTKIILTATPNFGYNFDGWYIGEEKVSDMATFEAEIRATLTYTAKFVTAPVEIKAIVVLAREDGTPYNETYDDGTTYNNAAKITVYNGENIIFEGAESAEGALEFTLEAELGSTYRVVITKNGYLTFDKEITIKTGNELSGIELIPGDIKGSYEDICGDGNIDIDDFIRVLRGFAPENSSKLSHAVDINEDRVVNVTDLSYVKAALKK